MKVIGVPLSPFVRKVIVVLNIKGIEFENEVVIPGSMPPEFREISPLMKIPVLQDGDFSVPDSSVICDYLEEKYPDNPVLPENPEDRAWSRFLEEFGDSRLIEAASIPFIENFAAPTFFGRQGDPERVKMAEEELLPPLLDYLDARVPPEGYLFGHFCTADIAIVSPLYNAALGNYTVDPERWPKYAAFINRVSEHPAVAAARDHEQSIMQALSGG